MGLTSILLIDDHALIIDGLRMLLKTRMPEIGISAASSLREAMQCDTPPDIIVLDIMLPGISGLEGIVPLKRKWPDAQIVMLSSQDDADTRQLALSRGAAVFVSKTEGGERIADTIYRLLHDGAPDQASDMAAIRPKNYLTPRQCEVLDLLSQGLTNKMIAKMLNLSDNTVRRHVQDIFAFFGVATRTEAVFAARRQGILL